MNKWINPSAHSLTAQPRSSAYGVPDWQRAGAAKYESPRAYWSRAKSDGVPFKRTIAGFLARLIAVSGIIGQWQDRDVG
jgi:hypothetical protein